MATLSHNHSRRTYVTYLRRGKCRKIQSPPCDRILSKIICFVPLETIWRPPNENTTPRACIDSLLQQLQQGLEQMRPNMNGKTEIGHVRLAQPIKTRHNDAVGERRPGFAARTRGTGVAAPLYSRRRTSGPATGSSLPRAVCEGYDPNSSQ